MRSIDKKIDHDTDAWDLGGKTRRYINTASPKNRKLKRKLRRKLRKQLNRELT